MSRSRTGDPTPRLRRFDENGNEYWDARELRSAYGYDKWERFEGVIKRAQDALRATGQDPDVVVSRVREATRRGDLGGVQKRTNYRLTGFGAYVVAMNGDPKKPQIAAP
ncbi:hypothetical protein [Streptomyces katrae]|uniref:hypothetical protein n=1 Tax=Streptomyces katrae TaxID=68223 RepID=UPI0012FF4F01|nr:hypothetical protein [Streptomyces katrae]